jgi:hypothetical protein
MIRMQCKAMALTVCGLLMVLKSTFAIANGIHPPVPILDNAGQAVMQSGLPMSTMETCGGDCHDTEYIAGSSDHADAGAGRIGKDPVQYDWQSGPGYFGGWDPISYDSDGFGTSGKMDLEAWLKRYGARHAGGGPVSSLVELDCLLCHGRPGRQSARAEALAGGDFRWANSTHLQASGALISAEGQWRWETARFRPDGSLLDGLLEIRKPADENCAQCHGQVENSLDQPLTISADLSLRHNTDRTGQLISPQKLLNSGLNIADKDSLGFAFDVHSDRVVGCVNCHYSLNNPVYFRQREESRPVHLDFDPRRLTSADYLERPLHHFAKGKSTLGLAAAASENSLRRCESCHDASSVHEWLPYRERHFSSLACESCHVPRLFGPALQSIDWTLLDVNGEPSRHYHGFDGDPVATDTLIRGFRPAILPRSDADGEWKLAPFNLVTSWYWTAGEPARPVTRAQLRDALLDGNSHHADLVAALDSNDDGKLTGIELQLKDESRLESVRHRLEQSGLSALELRVEITPFSISHNVVNGKWATRD